MIKILKYEENITRGGVIDLLAWQAKPRDGDVCLMMCEMRRAIFNRDTLYYETSVWIYIPLNWSDYLPCIEFYF